MAGLHRWARVSTLHPALADKLEKVKAEMLQLGPATIRAIVTWDPWDGIYDIYAIEGTHRTYAARILGIPLNIKPVRRDEIIDDHDVPGFPPAATAESIAEYALCPQPLMEVVLPDE